MVAYRQALDLGPISSICAVALTWDGRRSLPTKY
jgi:hypothetical protein